MVVFPFDDDRIVGWGLLLQPPFYHRDYRDYSQLFNVCEGSDETASCGVETKAVAGPPR